MSLGVYLFFCNFFSLCEGQFLQLFQSQIPGVLRSRWIGPCHCSQKAAVSATWTFKVTLLAPSSLTFCRRRCAGVCSGEIAAGSKGQCGLAGRDSGVRLSVVHSDRFSRGNQRFVYGTGAESGIGKGARLGAAWGYGITARPSLTLQSPENSQHSQEEEPEGRGPRGGALVSRGGKAQRRAKALTSSELLWRLAGSSRPCRTWQSPTSAPISSSIPTKSPPSGSPIHLTLQNLTLLPTPFFVTPPELRVP